MKKNFFLICALGILLTATAVVAVPIVSAQGGTPSTNETCENADGTEISGDASRLIRVSVPIPGVTGEMVCTSTGEGGGVTSSHYYVEDLGTYIAGIYEFFVSIVGILAAVMILYGGIRWVLAAGNQSRIQGAKNVIFSAIIGLVIAFTSYLLLYLLNPQLVNYDTLASHLTDVQGFGSEKEFKIACGEGVFTDRPVIPDRSQAAITLFPDIVGQYGKYAINAIYSEILQGNETLVTPAQYVACGDTATFVGENAFCIGDYCGGGGGLCIPEKYKCINGFLGGSIQWGGGAYVTAIRIRAICMDGQMLGTNIGRLGLVEQVDLSEATYYGFESKTTADNFTTADHFRTQKEECETNHEGLAGFVLDVTVKDDQGAVFNLGPTVDDSFGVGRDCDSILTSKDPINYTDTEWKQAFAEKKLFTINDFFEGGTISNDAILRTPYECNFNIDRGSFPAR